MHRSVILASILILGGACLSAQAPAPATSLPLDRIKLPAGFAIDIFSADVRNARSMARGPKGTIFVGTRTLGSVFAVRDEDADGKADKVFTIATGLNMPNGVAVRNGSLFVAEVNRILRFDAIEDRLASPPEPVVVYDKFPTERHHGWKFIAFGPDELLYVPVGAPCNICDERANDPRFASITRMKPDGTGLEVFANGVRNTVGFTWHPDSGAMWFTENGRDMLGDDVPPDELNVADRAGMDFGYPYCHGGDVKDPEFGDKRPCGDFTPPARELGPHVAALGLLFYRGQMFPPSYRGHLLIAEHGSWNRTVPLGYRLMLVKVEGQKAVSYEPFAEGWLQGTESWGRPVDLLVMPDGSLLVSDDKAGVIYRITYRG